MPLTTKDFDQIRKIVREELKPVKSDITGELKPIKSDLKEIKEDISRIKEWVATENSGLFPPIKLKQTPGV